MKYNSQKLREISFPLGGIGAGCIGLSGSGHLVDWEIFNAPNKGSCRVGFTTKLKAGAAARLEVRLTPVR